MELYNGLEGFCQHLRDKFDAIEEDALKLTTGTEKTYSSQNKRKRKAKKNFDYEGNDASGAGLLEDACESFRIETYLPIIDTLVAEIRRRKFVYCTLQKKFHFLLNVHKWSIDDIKHAAHLLLKEYSSDLASDFPEIVHFAFHLRSSSNLESKATKPQDMLSYLTESCLQDTFPNVSVILRIYLTLPVANAEGERSFSALKRVKTYLKIIPNTGTRLRFVHSIEKTFTKFLSFDKIVDAFAAEKSRKRQL